MHRRKFLVNTLSSSALLFLGSCVEWDDLSPMQLITPDTRFLLGDGHETINKTKDYVLTTSRDALFTISNYSGDYKAIKVPCRAHSISINPVDRNLAFTCSKWGNEAFIVDLQKKELVHDFISDIDTAFFGHNVFTSDGQFIFISVQDHVTKTGYISVRETKNYKEIRRISSYGSSPHELKWFVQDKVLVIANSKSLISDEQVSLLNIIDVKSGNLLKSYKTSAQNHNHFTITADQSKAFLGRSSRTNDTTLFEMLDLKNGHLTTQYLNYPLAIDRVESLDHVLFEDLSLVLTTVPFLKELVLWDYKNKKVIYKVSSADFPQSVRFSADKKLIYISFKTPGDDSFINIYHSKDILKYNFKPISRIKAGNGSHITVV